MLNTGHAYGSITSTMEVIKKRKKGNILIHWRNTIYIKRVKMDYK
jgi:hypothetical protein